ncbi:hypothetical protein ATSB10_37440 [Dyella thiooxydans]|uniref:Uncharacterized protein n=1 Tax=Dyella thiooxydans TaxID=445710 RepID=A0A160N646_9GAMM|nr:hypothetical protein ATSB10_37440 [Dyella thiooxydans]
MRLPAPAFPPGTTGGESAGADASAWIRSGVALTPPGHATFSHGAASMPACVDERCAPY